MAVQAVYQLLSNPDATMNGLQDEYLRFRAGMEVDGEQMVTPDGALFKSITNGIPERREDLEGLIVANRTDAKEEGAAPKPMEPLLHAVLLCGTYELLAHTDIDAPIIISDYVDVAKAFYDQSEPGFVNGILNSIQKIAR